MATHTFELFADYFQFYLQDEAATGDLSDAWTPDAVARLLALAPGTIGVGTARNMSVPVDVEILEAAPHPGEDLGGWDQVHECSIDVPSGRLVVAGCTDYFPDAARIALRPATHRARVYYAGLGTSSGDGPEGDDRYRLVLWRAPLEEPVVVKPRSTA